MNKADRAQVIDAWLEGRLTAEEANQFEQQMANDPDLTAQVQLYQMTLKAGKYLSEQALKAQVLEWLLPEISPVSEQVTSGIASQPASTESAAVPVKNWVIGALLLLILTLLAYVYRQNHTQTENTAAQIALARENADLKRTLENNMAPIQPSVPATPEIPAKTKEPGHKISGIPRPLALYKTPTDFGGLVRSENSAQELNTALKGAIDAFLAGDIKSTEQQARKIIREYPEQREAHRLLAHALLRQGKYLEASHEFFRLQSDYPAKREEAEWNLLLCYLALSDTADGERLYKQQLRLILAKPAHTWYKQAKALTQ